MGWGLCPKQARPGALPLGTPPKDGPLEPINKVFEEEGGFQPLESPRGDARLLKNLKGYKGGGRKVPTVRSTVGNAPEGVPLAGIEGTDAEGIASPEMGAAPLGLTYFWPKPQPEIALVPFTRLA